MTRLRRQRLPMPTTAMLLAVLLVAAIGAQFGSAVSAFSAEPATEAEAAGASEPSEPEADEPQLAPETAPASAENPQAYEPRYGGYDPIAIAQGLRQTGKPDFWSIYEKNLFLFDSEESKQEFDLDPRGALVQAEANWSHVRDTLTP